MNVAPEGISGIFQVKSVSKKILTLLVTAVLIIGVAGPSVQAEGEVEITGGSNFSGEIDSWLDVPGLSVSGTSEDPISVSLSVENGELEVQETTGISFFDDINYGNTINISGSIEDINAALASVRYRNSNLEVVNFVASITNPGEVYNPDNGHMYEMVYVDGGITANDAKQAAENRDSYGSTGYLATVTTQEENDFIAPRLNGDGWFGASDAEEEGEWKWISGPEAGDLFWSSDPEVSDDDDMFSNWASGEPNNFIEEGSENGEDCGQFYSDGSGWNDLYCDGSPLDYYVVEYGGANEDLPEISSTSFTITTEYPEGEILPIDSCLDLISIAENPLDHRYDTLQLTQDIDCTEQTVNPLFSGWDEEVGDYTFRGTFDGQGFSISNLVMAEETSPYGLIKYGENATFENITIASGHIGGEECVGALVGEATNSTFSNVTSNANVGGYSYIGGVVGCLYADDTNSSSISSSLGSGNISAVYVGGGLMGSAQSKEESSITIRDNEGDGSVVGDEQLGSIVGLVDAEEDSEIIISDNDSDGGVSGSWSTGGIAGETRAEGEATISITANTSSSYVEGGENAGGLIGYMTSYDHGDVNADNNTADGMVMAEYSVGGLIGSVYIDSPTGAASLSNSSASGEVIGENENVGGLVGDIYASEDEVYTLIDNCFATGDVSGAYEVGGLVGFANKLNITSSYSTSKVTGVSSEEYENSNEIGGLVGEADGTTITDSYATGDVSGAYEVGGLVGFADLDEDYIYDAETDTEDVVPVRSTITNSYYEGTVTGNSEIGGLVGDNDGNTIIKSYADATIEGIPNIELVSYYNEELDEYIEEEVEVEPYSLGGLVGRNNSDTYSVTPPDSQDAISIIVPSVIQESYSQGTINGNSQLGGLVGENSQSIIEDSYSRSDVIAVGDNQTEIGGAVGFTEIYELYEGEEFEGHDSVFIKNIYSTGAVTSNEGENVGGLIGQTYGGFEVSDSFWDTQSSNLNESAAGTGKNSDEMKNIKTYTDVSTVGLDESWDFFDVWGIYQDINDGYPCLGWSDADCDPNKPPATDLNGDSDSDSKQPHVAGYKNPITGKLVAIDVGENCELSKDGIVRESHLPVQDPAYDYDNGLWEFEADCGEEGYTTTVRLYYYEVDKADLVLRKFNPSTNGFFLINNASVTQESINGYSVAVVTYQITDGGELDTDQEVNGLIKDPAGLARLVVGAPNTGLGGGND